MNHLEIIKEAYDKCGINYVVRSYKDEDESLYSYLFLVGDSEDSKQHLERQELDRLLAEENFMEFENGDIASY